MQFLLFELFLIAGGRVMVVLPEGFSKGIPHIVD
jgi:hypothetical protein